MSTQPLDEREAEAIIQQAAKVARQNQSRRARECQPIGQACPTPVAPPAGVKPIDPPAEEERERRARVEKLLEACGVPARYRGGTLANLSAVPLLEQNDYRKAVERLQALTETQGVIVALLGPRGPGKSWMGCALVQDFCRAARSAVYLHAMDYFQAIKATYGRDARAAESAVESKYLRYELLVLDEIHERGETAWEDRTLTRLVSKRYDDNLTTVLVSNQTRHEFADRIGETIASRITDGGGVIECKWKSLRGRVLRTATAAKTHGSPSVGDVPSAGPGGAH